MSSAPLQAAMQCDGAFPTIPSFFRENSCQRDRCGLLSFNGTNSQIVSPFASVSLFLGENLPRYDVSSIFPSGALRRSEGRGCGAGHQVCCTEL